MNRLVLVTKNRFNPAYSGARRGADRTAAQFGATVEHHVREGTESVSDQLDTLESLLVEPPAALILHPYNDKRVDQAVERIKAKGVPVIFIVNKPEKVDCLTFVGSGDFDLAKSAAAHACQHIGSTGKVVILDGNLNAISTPLRGGGFRAAIAQFPDIELIDAAHGDYHNETSYDVTRQLLDRHPVIDAILACNDVSATGALAALDDAGRDITVIGINASPETVTSIRKGRLLASAAFDAMSIACLATEAAIRHLRGENVPSHIILPVELVTKVNSGKWNKPYEDRDCPIWDKVVKAI